MWGRRGRYTPPPPAWSRPWTSWNLPKPAVIYVGEDLDVLLELCDRILVLCGGQVSGIVDGRTTTKEEVGLLMTRFVKEAKEA